MQLREAIKLQMQRKGLKGTEVIKDLGIPRQDFYMYVNNGKKSVRQDTLMRICDRLGINLELKIEMT